MLEKNLNLKETLALAVQYHKKNNLEVAEQLYRKILKADPNNVISHNNLGMVLKELGQFQKAIVSYQKAIQIQPNHANAYNNLGNVLKKLRKFQEAKSCYEKAIKIQPFNIPSHNNLGLVFQELGDHQQAKSCYEKAIQINPNYADVYNNLGRVFQKLKESKKAISYYKKAIQIDTNHANAHYNLGLVFQELGDHQQAKSCYEKAIKIQPSHVNAHNNLGIIFQELGEFKKAISCYQKTLKYEPENLTYLYQLSDLKKEILDSKLKNKIDKIMKSDNSTKKNLAYGNFLLARYALQTKNYEKELNYLIIGHENFYNTRKKKFDLGIKYCFNDVLQIAKGAKMEELDKKKDYEVKPIFIVGVPRCGSTLLEKIIGSGKKFIPLGEETAVLENFVNAKIKEKKLFNLGNIKNIRNELFTIYKNKGLISKKYDYIFTDKSLNNFFYLELIKEIYPKAKIINCKREVLSSIISIFQNNLTSLAWTHDLDNIFKYFNNYFEIIKNFSELYPNFIYELQYEELINNPKEVSKKIMKFCGLPWHEKCLEFHKRKDLISRTASNIQIREAIYKHSSDKYLPYKKFLDKYGKKYYWYK